MSSAWASSSADGGPAPDGAGLPYVTGAVLSELVPIADAIAAIEGALRQPALDQADRAVAAVESGQLLLMDAVTLTPLALLDGVALTALRAPGVSAVASAALAMPEAAGMVVFGADLVLAVEEGAVRAQDLFADLRELVAGAPVDPYARSLSKSVDMAWEDLAVASVAYEPLSAGAP